MISSRDYKKPLKMVVHGEKTHRIGSAFGEAAPADITRQRTQTAQHPGQPIAMSEKSSNFAAQFRKAPGQPRNPTTIRDFLRPRDEEALRNN